MILTKEQCLSEELNPQSSAIDLGNPHLRDAIYYAMDLYRKDGAVEFLNWAIKKCSRPYEGLSVNKYNDGSEDSVYIGNEEFTISQLFELFLQSINQK